MVKDFSVYCFPACSTKYVKQLEKTLRDDAIVKSSTEDRPKLPVMRFDRSAFTINGWRHLSFDLIWPFGFYDCLEAPVQGGNLAVELLVIFQEAAIFWIKTVVGSETEYTVEILKPNHVVVLARQNSNNSRENFATAIQTMLLYQYCRDVKETNFTLNSS